VDVSVLLLSIDELMMPHRIATPEKWDATTRKHQADKKDEVLSKYIRFITPIHFPMDDPFHLQRIPVRLLSCESIELYYY
jgi:hypothetical protein